MKTVATLLAGLTLAALTTAVPAHADPPTTERRYDVTDPAGDVRTTGSSLPVADQQSIDVTRLKVGPRGATTRFEVELASVSTTSDFEQLVQVEVTGPAGAPWTLIASGTPQHPARARATWSPTLDADQSVRCKVRLTASDRLVRLDVPNACVPARPGKLKVFASTRISNATASQDTVQIRRVDLR